MGFKNFVSSRLRNNREGEGPSASDNSTTLDVRREELLAERTRIAQELHDTLLQGFLAASMRLHTAVDRLPADSTAKPEFQDITRLIDRVLEQGRLAVQGLRSPDEPLGPLGDAFAGVPDDLGL